MSQLNESQSKGRSIIRKKKYKKLLDLGVLIENKSQADDTIEDTCRRVGKIFSNLNEISTEASIKDKAENTMEVVMDVSVVKMGHELVDNALQKLGNSNFEQSEYLACIRRLILKTGAEDWKNFSRIVTSVSRRCVYNQPMFGTFDYVPEVQEKVVKERAVRKKQDLAVEKRPEKISQLEPQNKGSERIRLIMGQLKRIYTQRDEEPIPYYELICDPDNFMHTVDNAFQISFLARDGLVKMLIGKDKMPEIRPTNSAETKMIKSNLDLPTVQSIVSLDYKLWKSMLKKYHVKKPLLILNREEDD